MIKNDVPKSFINAQTIEASRLGSLADGVIAIVMTLLIFDLKLPDTIQENLINVLIKLWPNFLGYTISFLLLGMYWIGHRGQFNYIQRADGTLYWINIFYFAFVSLVPFSTKLISRFPHAKLSILIYGINLIIIGLLLYLHWSYAIKDYRLVDSNIDIVILKFAKLKSLTAPLFYLIAIISSLISTKISLAIYFVVPVFYIVPQWNKYWMRLAVHLANKESSKEHFF